MPKDIHNIHDKFVRDTFSNAERTAAFLERFLPEALRDDLDLSGLKVIQESYITEELKEYFSDLVFEVSVKGKPELKADVVLLFEHKSSPDKHVLIQVGHYMFAHLYKCVQEKQAPKPIIPIIYYQGKAQWEAPSLKDIFTDYPESIKSYVPELDHIFIALYMLMDDQIAGIRNGLMAAALTAQKLRDNPALLIEDLIKIFKLFPERDLGGNFLFKIFIYSLETSEVTEEQLAISIQAIPENLKDNIMATYTRILEKREQIGIQKGKVEGEQIGIQKGEQIGIQKKEVDVVLSSFDNKLDVAIICSITKLDEDKVMSILKEHGRV